MNIYRIFVWMAAQTISVEVAIQSVRSSSKLLYHPVYPCIPHFHYNRTSVYLCSLLREIYSAIPLAKL